MPAPAISSITPASGPSAGGTSITITGTDFDGLIDVLIDGVSLGWDSADNAGGVWTIITTTAPHVAGVLDVAVPATGGTAHTSFEFTGEPPPPPDPLTGPCVLLSVPGLLADGATPDGDTICYTVQALDGWFDSPPQRTGTLEANPRGETITVAQTLARTVDVQIVAHIAGGQLPLGNILCFTAIETIKTAFRAVFVPVLMQVADPSGQQRTMLTRRVGPIKSQILGAGVAVRFNIPMLGENPVLVTV